MQFPLFPPFAFPFYPGIASSHLSSPPLTVSTVCIKRPVIHHRVRAECSSCYPSVCRLLVCQPSRTWNQSPNPETLKPSGRVRQRQRRKPERVSGRKADIQRYKTRNWAQINSTAVKLSPDHFVMGAKESRHRRMARSSSTFPPLLGLLVVQARLTSVCHFLCFSGCRCIPPPPSLSLRPKYSILSQWKDLSGLYPHLLHPEI